MSEPNIYFFNININIFKLFKNNKTVFLKENSIHFRSENYFDNLKYFLKILKYLLSKLNIFGNHERKY